MRQGQTIRVRAVVEAELIPGSLDVVSGIIPGTKYPDEEIVVSAHLDHYKPGASDNASGSASILEMLAWPDNYYHSSEDSPDKVDPTQLHRVVFSGLAAMTMIGYADDPNAGDFARQSFVYGKKRIQASEAQASLLLLSAMPENFVERENRSKNLIRHVYQREAAAIGSSRVFARTDASRKSIELTAAILQDDEAVSRENLEELATTKAAALKLTRKPYILSASERRASRSFPARKKDQQLLGMQYVFGKLAADSTVNLQTLNAAFAQAANNMRTEGANDLQIWSLYDAAAYYADGQRSILEIRDAVAAEYTPIPIEGIEKYFRAFEKVGVMTITEK